jgi:uncharacterized radical SAM superfamily protein
MDIATGYCMLDCSDCGRQVLLHKIIKMNKSQALIALKRIQLEPGIADQYTEEEIEKLEELAAKK